MAKAFKSIILLIVLVISISACTTTKVISSWKADYIPDNVMDKVIVLGIMGNREQIDQNEQAMVQHLKNEGINAATATSVFGPKGFKGLSEDEITEKLRGSEFTSIMMLSLLDKEREKNYFPGSRYTVPRVVGYSRYYRRYLVVNDYVYTPGYYTSSTNYILEAEIYSIDDGELVYSAQTRSYDPANIHALAESFAKSIVSELNEKGIIRK